MKRSRRAGPPFLAADTEHTSLDRSAGRVFLNLIVGIEVVANRRARSTRTFGRLVNGGEKK